MEIWKDISGHKNYEGKYQISNLGDVKSLNYRRTGKEQFLKFGLDKDGYKIFNLNSNTKTGHRLVAQAFIPNPENKPQVNHKNGIRDDNRIENLEWCTAKENMQHSYRVLKRKSPNFQKYGKNNHRSKKINQYTLNLEFIRTWESTGDARRGLNISSGSIIRACNGIYKTAGGFIWRYI